MYKTLGYYNFIFRSVILLILIILFFEFGSREIYADVTPFRSAGWVESEGDTLFTNLDKCQATDEEYCTRSSAPKAAALYFGSFPDLEDFGIPLSSKINNLLIKITGKSGGYMLVALEGRYNQIPARSSCQKPFDLLDFYIGPINRIVELNKPLNTNNGLINCITLNNVNYRNLTFRIGPSYSTSGYYADIDNFEIAFDYTPPAITPTPLDFPSDQKGTVWEVGPDKTNIVQKTGIDDIVSVVIGSNFSVALKKDGTVWMWTNSDKTPKQIKGENGVGILTDVKKVSAGDAFVLVLKSDGSVWEWNQIGNDPQNPVPVKQAGVNMINATDIAAGSRHKIVLKSDGKVYGWGLNNDGQIGIGCFLYNCSSVSSPTQTKDIDSVKAITAGWGHTLALKNDGTVWGWGESAGFALGKKIQENGNTGFSERPLPNQITELSDIKHISSGGFYNLAINNNGEVFEWGNFAIGIPRKVTGVENVKIVSARPSNISFGVLGHFIKNDGTLWQLYINDIPPKQVPLLKDVVGVASGDLTLAVINSSGDVLGDSTIKPFLDLPFDYITAGKTFEQVVKNPESWFDHKYPLQNVWPLTFKVLKYSGGKDADDAYRSHSGYDYALNNGVKLNTPVLAAASGSATFIPESNSGGAGHMIKIDHGNGYQTWYEHLDYNGIITTSDPVYVTKGQQIGKVGMTGRTNGPHIHFSVFKDANNNGNFDDDYPFGLVDPLGWEGDYTDPWTEYKVGERSGSSSLYLFDQRALPINSAATTTGGTLTGPNIQVEVPSGATTVPLMLTFKNGPFESASEKIKSVVPSFYLTATNNVGDEIKNFLKTIKIIYKYATSDLVVFKEGTLKMYNYNPDTEKWEEVPSTLDTEKKEITAETTHFSQFAVMGELKDIVPPVTDVKIIGTKGDENWYSSNLEIILSGIDNDGGMGLEYTLYSLDDEEWKEYKLPRQLSSEGSHSLKYQSIDVSNNKEEQKSLEVKIDKTKPITTAQINGTEGENGWYVSDVKIKLLAEDSASGVTRTEYSLDNGETYNRYTSELLIDKEGASDILYRSVDKAGNVEVSKKANIKIDKTPPSTLVYRSGQRGLGNWYRSNVELALTGNDSISGYKTSFYSLDDGEIYVEYLEPIILSNEGLHKIYYYSIDVAGNIEEKEFIEVRIDKTLPVISLSTNPTRLWPANGKMVDVKINGEIIEDNLLSKSFKLSDEYNLINLAINQFGQVIKLEARKNGSDRDGRVYYINAFAEDFAGNKSDAEAKVIVPHDQRN
jgi:murein DD-endopeptidase MepM/ murein hydrolase activator NlpD